MLDEGGNVHTFQTWDSERSVWLDPMRARDLNADEVRQVAVQETAAQTRMETRLEIRMEDLLALLRQHVAQGALAPDVPHTLAAAWQKAQWVPDFAEALRVTNGERDWLTLLPPGDYRT